MYILVVDDNLFANALVQFVLAKEGYEVATIDNPNGAMQMIQRREPDLLLLDVSMPYLDGFQFSEKLRAEGYETPLIFVTAKDELESKLHGFHIGADDYICKPYNHQELVARVQAVLRRIKKQSTPNNHSVRSGQIELLPAELKVVVPGRAPIMLTYTEMQVLRVLMAASGQAVDRNQLLSVVWNEEGNSSNIVDVYIGRLRRKLGDYIISVRGIGYKFQGK